MKTQHLSRPATILAFTLSAGILSALVVDPIRSPDWLEGGGSSDHEQKGLRRVFLTTNHVNQKGKTK